MNWKEFKPTIFFLLRFLSFYLIGNLLYGFFVTAYEPHVDPITEIVTGQSARALSFLGWNSKTAVYDDTPTVSIVHKEKSVVSVYEGCNGISVAIIFISFLIAFGPRNTRMLWFIPLGLALIHFANLMRIGLLFFVSIHSPQYLYFTHKYLFTAIIYFVVLVLWLFWVKKHSEGKTEKYV